MLKPLPGPLQGSYGNERILRFGPSDVGANKAHIGSRQGPIPRSFSAKSRPIKSPPLPMPSPYLARNLRDCGRPHALVHSPFLCLLPIFHRRFPQSIPGCMWYTTTHAGGLGFGRISNSGRRSRALFAAPSRARSGPSAGVPRRDASSTLLWPSSVENRLRRLRSPSSPARSTAAAPRSCVEGEPPLAPRATAGLTMFAQHLY